MVKVRFEVPNHKELTKDYTVVDMHSHTQASFDCSTDIKSFTQRIRELGMGVAITDHDEIKGSLWLKKHHPTLFQIPGIEVTSNEKKHILLYFTSHKDLEHFYTKHILLNKKKQGRTTFVGKTRLSYEYILDLGKDYNAVRVLPHPFIRVIGIFRSIMKTDEFKIMKKVEGIEVINPTQSYNANLKSLAWAHLENKAYTAGSDSHVLSTLGNTVTISKATTPESFLEAIRKKQNTVIGKSNTVRADFLNLRTIIKNHLLGKPKNKREIEN